MGLFAPESKQEKDDWMSKIRLAISEAPRSFESYGTFHLSSLASSLSNLTK